MKTVKEWFESIKDEDVRRRALANMRNNTYRISLQSAIFWWFKWEETDEGYEYWFNIHLKSLENNEL